MSSNVFHIFSINSDGSNIKLLADTGNNKSPSWSPDGTKIVFSSDISGAYPVIYTVNADCTNQISHHLG
jgi:TolB protein